MQYGQRKLQRSITEMRRSRSGRPEPVERAAIQREDSFHGYQRYSRVTNPLA